jgi:alginate O-acetyltransferase complex protein AlgI
VGLTPTAWGLLVLGIGVVVHWRLAARWRPWVLAATGVLALGPVAPIAVASTALGTTALWAALGRPPGRARTVTLIAVLLTVLFGFKIALAVTGGKSGLILPLGLSFITFRLVHYVVERSRGVLPRQPLGEVLGWILMLPAFTAGPIERLDHHQRHREATFARAQLVEGGRRIAWGLIKKLVLADALLGQAMSQIGADADMVAGGLHFGQLSVAHAWRFAALSLLHLYLDFSGYTDLAVGAGRLFGLRITENFRWPMFARGPADFWRRWHTSLADFCRSYVYMPVLGKTRSPYIALLATFGTMGLWHAPAPGWILWGLYHAAFMSGALAWTRARRGKGPLPLWTGVLTIPLTMAYAVAGHGLAALHGHTAAREVPWLFFRMFGYS